VRCWRDIGRALYFVDVHTGRLIKKIHADAGVSTDRIFPSPIVSGPALYRSDTGGLASRAFVVDADGVIWRIDMTSIDPVPNDPMAGWTVRPFHDIFWDRAPALGELTYEPPMLSTDESGQLVVLVGTGDSNNFVKPTVENRVVSLTEVIDPTVTDPTSPLRYKASLNWEKRVKTAGIAGRNLVASELVTGNMGLFNGQLFFGTFIAITGTDACDLGKGRIHAVHYLNRDASDPNGSTPETYGPELITGIVPPGSLAEDIINVPDNLAINNLMLMGLGITQRPSCAINTTGITDYYESNATVTNTTEPPALYLVAQGSGDSSLLQKAAGAAGSVRLSGIQIQLNKRGSVSRMLSIATSVD
jgi:hypothetical protein